MKNKKLLIPALFLAFGALAGCEEEIPSRPSSESSSEIVKAEEIELDRGVLKLAVGSDWTLDADTDPVDVEETLTWKTSDANVATVDQTGKVTAVAEGTAKISYENADGTVKDECDVTVVAAKTAFTDVEKSWIEAMLASGYMSSSASSYSKDQPNAQFPFVGNVEMTDAQGYEDEDTKVVSPAFRFEGVSMTADQLAALVESYEELTGVVITSKGAGISNPWVATDGDIIAQDLDLLTNYYGDAFADNCVYELRYECGLVACDELIVGLDEDGVLVMYAGLYESYLGDYGSGDPLAFKAAALDGLNYCEYLIELGFGAFEDSHSYKGGTFVYPAMWEGSILYDVTEGEYLGLQITDYEYIYPFTIGNPSSSYFDTIYQAVGYYTEQETVTDFITAVTTAGFVAGEVDKYGFTPYVLTDASGIYTIDVKTTVNQQYGLYILIAEYSFEAVYESDTFPTTVVQSFLAEKAITTAVPALADAGITSGFAWEFHDATSAEPYDTMTIEVEGNWVTAYGTVLTDAGWTYNSTQGYFNKGRVYIFVQYVAETNTTYITIQTVYYSNQQVKNNLYSWLVSMIGFDQTTAAALANSVPDAITTQIISIGYGDSMFQFMFIGTSKNATTYIQKLVAAGFTSIGNGCYQNADGTLTVAVGYQQGVVIVQIIATLPPQTDGWEGTYNLTKGETTNVVVLNGDGTGTFDGADITYTVADGVVTFTVGEATYTITTSGDGFTGTCNDDAFDSVTKVAAGE